MNVFSAFDGISCGKVAFELAGIPLEKYIASEIDKNAIAISEKNHKDIIRMGDITKWREWELPKIDLLIGGSPCQGFSRAGRHLNFDDPRSALFFDYVDILYHLKSINPDMYFLLENVKMKKEWEDIITEFLEVEPIEIDSGLVSAQKRVRMYWTNIPNVKRPEDKNIKLSDILEGEFTSELPEQQKNIIERVNGEIRIKQATKRGYIVAKEGDGVNLSFPNSKTRRGRVIKQKSPTLDCSCDVCVVQNGNVRKLTIRELERLQTLPDGYTEGFPESVAKKAIGNGWTVDVIAHIFSSLSKN